MQCLSCLISSPQPPRSPVWIPGSSSALSPSCALFPTGSLRCHFPPLEFPLKSLARIICLPQPVVFALSAFKWHLLLSKLPSSPSSALQKHHIKLFLQTPGKITTLLPGQGLQQSSALDFKAFCLNQSCFEMTKITACKVHTFTYLTSFKLTGKDKNLQQINSANVLNCEFQSKLKTKPIQLNCWLLLHFKWSKSMHQ